MQHKAANSLSAHPVSLNTYEDISTLPVSYLRAHGFWFVGLSLCHALGGTF